MLTIAVSLPSMTTGMWRMRCSVIVRARSSMWVSRSQVRTSVVDTLSGGPLAVHAHGLAHTISSGDTPHAIASTPAPLRGLVATTARSALVDGLNTILLVAACVAFVAAVVSFVLIREQDFVVAEVDEAPAELAVAA